MWIRLARFILQMRLPLFLVIVAQTVFFGFFAGNVGIDYGFSKLVPEDHPQYVRYQEFKQTFGEDGDLLVMALKSDQLFEKELFNRWAVLGDDIMAVEGVNQVVSLAHAVTLEKNRDERKFEIVPVVAERPQTPQEAAGIKRQWDQLPFYHNMLYFPDSNLTIMVAQFEPGVLNSKNRSRSIDAIDQLVETFESATGKDVRISGLPYIRTYKTEKTKEELVWVLLYAVGILILILLLLFRSWTALIYPIVVISIGVVWALGLIDLLGYKITVLTALLPNLIVIISIPNCVYLLNKYHAEYRKHGDKSIALSRVIEKIGYVTFFANLTTAIGFAVFSFTESQLLVEFGVITGIMIASMFIISIVSVPIIFSYLPPPKANQTAYLRNRLVRRALHWFNHVVVRRRKLVYVLSVVILAVTAYGLSKVESRGYILDDVPKDNVVYQDLQFMERELKGIMPVEVLVDTRERNGAFDLRTLEKVDAVQDSLYAHPWFSKPASVVNGLKFATQAYFNGNPKRYRLPRKGLTNEMNLVTSYLQNSDLGGAIGPKFTDSTNQIIRISSQVPDVGSHNLDSLKRLLKQKYTAVFDTTEYDIAYTGSSLAALEGYDFITRGLIFSVGMAFVLIALIMGYLFRSFKMLAISLLPNLVPLCVTAGIMGYAGIPLKPSTVLVFSVAFGISVDFTIHFLAKYRQELSRHNWNIQQTVTQTIHEVGISMVFTSMILFAGFITFTTSSFDGTKYMGLLVSITLVSSLFSNMIVLPSLLMSFEKRRQKKQAKQAQAQGK